MASFFQVKLLRLLNLERDLNCGLYKTGEVHLKSTARRPKTSQNCSGPPDFCYPPRCIIEPQSVFWAPTNSLCTVTINKILESWSLQTCSVPELFSLTHPWIRRVARREAQSIRCLHDVVLW